MLTLVYAYGRSRPQVGAAPHAHLCNQWCTLGATEGGEAGDETLSRHPLSHTLRFMRSSTKITPRRSLYYASMRLSKFPTDDGYQRPPRGVIISRLFSSSAMAASVNVPSSTNVLHHYREITGTLGGIGANLSNDGSVSLACPSQCRSAVRVTAISK